jgi:hypothetical protein
MAGFFAQTTASYAKTLVFQENRRKLVIIAENYTKIAENWRKS